MLNYIELHIVDHCNLKCRGCSHFSGLAKPYFKPLDEFKVEMQDLAEKEEVRTIRLMGGEPLLSPEWERFVAITRECFPRANIFLVSNGLLLGKFPDIDKTLAKYNARLCVSDYGLSIHKEKASEVHNKWKLYNISLDLSGSQSINKSWLNCDLAKHGWYFFKNGRIYNCCVFANIDHFIGHFNTKIEYDIDDVSISVKDHTANEIERFLRTPHKACKYCNTELRERSYQPFAVSKGEIEEWTYQ